MRWSSRIGVYRGAGARDGRPNSMPSLPDINSTSPHLEMGHPVPSVAVTVTDRWAVTLGVRVLTPIVGTLPPRVQAGVPFRLSLTARKRQPVGPSPPRPTPSGGRRWKKDVDRFAYRRWVP